MIYEYKTKTSIVTYSMSSWLIYNTYGIFNRNEKIKQTKGTKSNSALLQFLPDKSQIKMLYKIQKLFVSTIDFTEF